MELTLIVGRALQSLLILCLLLAPEATQAKTDSLRKELDTIASILNLTAQVRESFSQIRFTSAETTIYGR